MLTNLHLETSESGLWCWLDCTWELEAWKFLEPRNLLVLTKNALLASSHLHFNLCVLVLYISTKLNSAVIDYEKLYFENCSTLMFLTMHSTPLQCTNTWLYFCKCVKNDNCLFAPLVKLWVTESQAMRILNVFLQHVDVHRRASLRGIQW